jgi:hypothetical protein
LLGFGVSAAALILILISLGSSWTGAYRRRVPDLGLGPETPTPGIWDSPAWLTAAYIATIVVVATLLALCLVEAPPRRPRLGALGYAAIAAQIVIVFGVAHRQVSALESNGYFGGQFDSGSYVAVFAALASGTALAFAIRQPRASWGSKSSAPR